MSNDTESRLRDLFCESFGERHRAHINAETTMDDIDEWDSMSFIDLVEEIEETFGVSFSPSEFAQMFRFGNIVALLKTKS